MQIITLDYETFYSKQFSLSKITTEEYIRSPLFETIGVGIKVGNGETRWVTGSHADIKYELQSLPWDTHFLLGHNTMFDGAILAWLYKIKPKGYLDTMSMARAWDGVNVSASLANTTKRHNLGVKGTEVVNALGKRAIDFDDEQLDRYGEYCIQDVELTYKLFLYYLRQGFPKSELRVIDLTLRMFIEPILKIDKALLESHLITTRFNKQQLLDKVNIDKTKLMSNMQFAELLRARGVEPPMKKSPTTGKMAFAFAKTDKAFRALEDHPDTEVQALVAARVGNKSTLEESRTERFIGMADRGDFAVPIRYYAAHTGRFGGADKVNIQNLPSRVPKEKKALKRSIIAPDGYLLVDCDSSQIEARVLAWLAEQTDLVDDFANGRDVYKIMASDIYNKPVDEIDKWERAIGKGVILGSGYGMGPDRFKEQLRIFGTDIDIVDAELMIASYRKKYSRIKALWYAAGATIQKLANNIEYPFGRKGVLQVDVDNKGIRLPNGLLVRYPDLDYRQNEDGDYEHMYKVRKGYSRIYGPKCVENVVQALARLIITEQMLEISKRYKVCLTVHDSVVCAVPEYEAEEARAYIETCMKTTPQWATGCPITCESGIAKSYGDCE